MGSPSNNAPIQPMEEDNQLPIPVADAQAIVPMDAAAAEDAGDDEVQEEEDREYRCKFCDKKFTNKQALGGHQNAHKIERSVEKTSREMHESAVSILAAAAQSSNARLSALINLRGAELLMNRANLPWSLPGPQQNQPYYNVPRPVMHVPEPNYGPRPLNNNLYQAWAQPAPRMPYLPAPNPNYFNQGGFVGFQPAAPAFPGPLRLGPPEINFGRGEDFDESGLDLALRL